ncbi:hypothetical protein VD0002_g4805 [Verticillium dahliae]|nr:hypothetical protein VD0002_g4805 [Verticillium dahliae]
MTKDSDKLALLILGAQDQRAHRLMSERLWPHSP